MRAIAGKIESWVVRVLILVLLGGLTVLWFSGRIAVVSKRTSVVQFRPSDTGLQAVATCERMAFLTVDGETALIDGKADDQAFIIRGGSVHRTLDQTHRVEMWGHSGISNVQNDSGLNRVTFGCDTSFN